MMNNNKILTVSYGTFSCTLEGFEDSFETMKAIAEYFRDLAADDRYFGAEPPQPDAEMLARIAEREVARRVEAREHEGRIMLKAHEEPVAAQPAPVAPAVAAAAAAVAEAAVPAAEPASPAPAPQPTQAFDAPYTDTPEPPVFAEEATPTVASEPAAEPAYAPVAEDLAAPADDHAQQEDTLMPGADTVDSVAAFFADSRLEEAADPETEEAISIEAFTGYISPAAVAEAQADDQLTADSLADDDADDDAPEAIIADEDEVMIEDASQDRGDEVEAYEPVADSIIEDAEAAEYDAQGGEPEEVIETEEIIEAEEVMARVTMPESFADKLARIRAVVSKKDDDAMERAYSDEFEDEFEDELDAAPSHPQSAPRAAFSPMDTDLDAPLPVRPSPAMQKSIVTDAAQDIEEALAIDDTSADEAALSDEDLGELDDVLRGYDDAPEGEAAAGGDNLFSEDGEDDAEEVRARVMRVRKSDLQAAIDAGMLSADDEDEYDDENSSAAFDAADEDGAEDDEIAAQQEEVAAGGQARQMLPAIDEAAGEDVSRLMAEAEHQMAEPEGRTRRSAFAHLRAAVAARFADRTMDLEDQNTEEKVEAYRSDLAEVVKPRRPAGAEPRSERPAEPRQAPLKLVAEQRIDRNDGKSLDEVAPRRVAASLDEEEDGAPADSGFAAYAEERGATTLPELLEAAASYMCFVEGQGEFSRPQLMTRVRQADCGDFSREDGLRSFGQLLRTGKIEKLKGGRFAASDAIGYKPDHRAAG